MSSKKKPTEQQKEETWTGETIYAPARRIATNLIVGNRPSTEVPGIEAIIGGRVKSTEVKTSDKGESIQFNGDFEAQYLDAEGKPNVRWAEKCFLPPLAEKDLHRAMETAMDAGTGFVDFIYKVYAVKADVPIGYQWEFEPLHQPNKPKSILAPMMQALGGSNAPKLLSEQGETGEAA